MSNRGLNDQFRSLGVPPPPHDIDEQFAWTANLLVIMLGKIVNLEKSHCFPISWRTLFDVPARIAVIFGAGAGGIYALVQIFRTLGVG